MHLADMTGGDVRSCLSTLQFLARRFRHQKGKMARSISAVDVKTTSVGVKDKVPLMACALYDILIIVSLLGC